MKADRKGALAERLLFWLLGLALLPSASAEVLIEQERPLRFGTIAVPGNDSDSTLELPASGSNQTVDGNIVLVTPGEPGLVRMAGLPPNMGLELEVDDASLTAAEAGSSEALAVTDYTSNDLRTDGNGEFDLVLGGTLATSGSGTPYPDAPYLDSVTVRITYWSPEEETYVSNSGSIEITTEVRTSLDIKYLQQLSFGTLFARTTPSHQASLTLAPDGEQSVDNPGNARLVVLSPPSVGVFEVVGAAPNYSLSITPQAGETRLRHEEDPENAPEFILESIITDPAGEDVRTESDGALEISVGATLKTEATDSTVVYPSGTYSGEYEITVEY